MKNGVTSIINAAILQCILSAVSLPFLLWWHIPYPALSIIGNMLHPLFLTSVLLLSSLIFFTTLMAIPDGALVWLLTTITSYWKTVLWLPVPSGWIALHPWHIIPAYSVAIILLCWYVLPGIIRHKYTITIVLIVINSITCGWHIHAGNNRGITFLHKKNNHLVCIPHDDHIELIDFGYIKNTRNKAQLMAYDIMPHLLFSYGIEKIVIDQN